MAKKKKILAWCDFVVDTGFGIVAKNLLEELHKTYDVSILGINYQGNKKYDTSKYFVYSITREDMLGFKRIIELAKEEKPDLIFLFQDIFHISEIIQQVASASPSSKIVCYFPVDGSPFSVAWKNVLEISNSIITYTDWAIETIREKFPNLYKPIHKLYHGVDTNIFKELPQEVITNIRINSGFEHKFVVTNVNRFQPRKAIPLGIRAFSMFALGYKTCKCGNEFPIFRKSCDLNMCPESDIVAINNEKKNDVFLYLHMMPQEFTMGPGKTNLLQHHLMNAGFSDSEYGKVCGINAKNIYGGEVSLEQLNEIYNASNVNISTSIGEGAGLSLIESAATGTPSIAPRNSAIPEQLNNTGILVDNITIYSHPFDNAHVRPVVDTKKFRQALEIKYKEWKESGKEKVVDRFCIDNVNKNFLWPDKRDILYKIFADVLA